MMEPPTPENKRSPFVGFRLPGMHQGSDAGSVVGSVAGPPLTGGVGTLGATAGSALDPSKLTMKKVKVQKKEVTAYHVGSTVFMSVVVGQSELAAIASPFVAPGSAKEWVSSLDVNRRSSTGARGSPYNKSLKSSMRSPVLTMQATRG
jgi:hypothetical protein